MTTMYRQCQLSRQSAQSALSYVTWLPERFAIQGGLVRLREGEGQWSAAWRVDEVGSWRISEEHMRKAERAHMKARRSELSRESRITIISFGAGMSRHSLFTSLLRIFLDTATSTSKGMVAVSFLLPENGDTPSRQRKRTPLRHD